jgi:hypothetical protein
MTIKEHEETNGCKVHEMRSSVLVSVDVIEFRSIEAYSSLDLTNVQNT